jgi:hypothetical protein
VLVADVLAVFEPLVLDAVFEPLVLDAVFEPLVLDAVFDPESESPEVVSSFASVSPPHATLDKPRATRAARLIRTGLSRRAGNDWSAARVLPQNGQLVSLA